MPKTNYVCEFCEQNFKEDRQACLDHEKTAHTEPRRYSDIVAEYYNDLSKYPDGIEITMNNGAVVRYDFVDVIKEPVEEPKTIESPPAIGSSQESQKEEPFTF